MDSNMYSLNNFGFLARSFARMQAEGHPINIQAVIGNMDGEHRSWFCERYALYCQQATEARKLELEHQQKNGPCGPLSFLLLRIN